jgi:hypothetical protein
MFLLTSSIYSVAMQARLQFGKSGGKASVGCGFLGTAHIQLTTANKFGVVSNHTLLHARTPCYHHVPSSCQGY